MTTINNYFDEMMNRTVADELTKRSCKVILANDVGMTEKLDEDHLAYASEYKLVLVTLDRKFAMQAAEQTNHMGVICWTGTFQNIGVMVRALTDFAENHTHEEVVGRVFWLK
jgi:predicted nuclease of predicted toxin-antitoxin system